MAECHYNAHCAFFTAQVLFSFTTMVFVMAMLFNGQDTGVYLPILSSVVSVWMPSPSIPKKPWGRGGPKMGPPPLTPSSSESVPEGSVLAA